MCIKKLIISSLLILSTAYGGEFTVASYNCGGLPGHYDYIRSVALYQLTLERALLEPEVINELETIQKLALKIIFTEDPLEKHYAKQLWESEEYANRFLTLTSHPHTENSINAVWREKNAATVSGHKIRPTVIYNNEVKALLENHVQDLTGKELNSGLEETIQVMAKKIFKEHLNFDLIALQEAYYMNPALFTDQYEVKFSEHNHNGIAWNKERFELIETLGEISSRGFVLLFVDKESGKKVAVASGHLTGCNPFEREFDSVTGEPDSAKGSRELMQILEILEQSGADIKILAMDSNVTATHPRLHLLKDTSYLLDYNNHLEPTCTSPWQILPTRIDWIAGKSSNTLITLKNIPIEGVGLNDPYSNMSDHNPIATMISFE